jgi:hypothetical protein
MVMDNAEDGFEMATMKIQKKIKRPACAGSVFVPAW